MSRLFDGIDDVLAVASAPVTAAPLTLGCWFRSTSAAANQALMSVNDAANNRFLMYAGGAVGGDPVVADTLAAGAGSTASTSTGYTASAWQHACAVYAAANDRRAFINGGGKGTNATTRTPTGINAFRIGLTATGSAPTVGRIAEAAIWNVALTDAEVNALAKGINPRRIRPGNLVFYAPLWGNGSPEPDYTAGQRHLTVTGATVAPGPPVQAPSGLGQFWVPPTAAAGGTVKDGAASLLGEASLTGAAKRDRNGVASLTGVGQLTTSGSRDRGGAVSLVGNASLTATASRTRDGAVSMTGVGTLASAANQIINGAASLTGTASLTGACVRVRVGATTLNGSSSLVGAGALDRRGAISLVGNATLTAVPHRDRTGAASLLGVGTLTATGTGGQREWTYDHVVSTSYGGTAVFGYDHADDWTYEPVTG